MPCKRQIDSVSESSDKTVLAFAELIGSAFRPCAVADAAGGQGALSNELRTLGFAPTIIDPKVRIRAANRLIRCERETFVPEFHHYPLVVALHPCGSTLAVCMAAALGPVLVVPCCNHWMGNLYTRIRRLWNLMRLVTVAQGRLGTCRNDRWLLAMPADVRWEKAPKPTRRM